MGQERHKYMYTLLLTQLECVMILVSEITWRYPPLLESYSRQIKHIGSYFMRIHEPLNMVRPGYCSLLLGFLCNIGKLRFLWFLPTLHMFILWLSWQQCMVVEYISTYLIITYQNLVLCHIAMWDIKSYKLQVSL